MKLGAEISLKMFLVKYQTKSLLSLLFILKTKMNLEKILGNRQKLESFIKEVGEYVSTHAYNGYDGPFYGADQILEEIQNSNGIFDVINSRLVWLLLPDKHPFELGNDKRDKKWEKELHQIGLRHGIQLTLPYWPI